VKSICIQGEEFCQHQLICEHAKLCLACVLYVSLFVSNTLLLALSQDTSKRHFPMKASKTTHGRFYVQSNRIYSLLIYILLEPEWDTDMSFIGELNLRVYPNADLPQTQEEYHPLIFSEFSSRCLVCHLLLTDLPTIGFYIIVVSHRSRQKNPICLYSSPYSLCDISRFCAVNQKLKKNISRFCYRYFTPLPSLLVASI